ncbi:hypothetical protein ACRAWC_23430 [Leifsonia sp. L25]|uniref:hypothetical protein n=1 Tax=Leifsonia sp. L25 TaxID=3423957 RepID=UPI003D687C2E
MTRDDDAGHRDDGGRRRIREGIEEYGPHVEVLVGGGPAEHEGSPPASRRP